MTDIQCDMLWSWDIGIEGEFYSLIKSTLAARRLETRVYVNAHAGIIKSCVCAAVDYVARHVALAFAYLSSFVRVGTLHLEAWPKTAVYKKARSQRRNPCWVT